MNVHSVDISVVNPTAAKTQLIIDVRSPKEFTFGHIPGAINIPLLDDDERVQVGTMYKTRGRTEAVQLGFELVGSRFAGFAQQARALAEDRQALVYCWRGGMRSEIMTWVFGLAGVRAVRVTGGYKAWRNVCLDLFSRSWKVNLISGPTGSGKTELLLALTAMNEQIIDFEALACHRGSAFGGLGLGAQPTQAQFENTLAMTLLEMDPEKRVWVEDESRFIGKVKIPDRLFSQVECADEVELKSDIPLRVSRIIREYGGFARADLEEKTLQIRKRMGPEQNAMALALLQENDLTGWATQLLSYYDKAYQHTINQRRKVKRTRVLGMVVANPIEDFSKLALEARDLADHHEKLPYHG